MKIQFNKLSTIPSDFTVWATNLIIQPFHQLPEMKYFVPFLLIKIAISSASTNGSHRKREKNVSLCVNSQKKVKENYSWELEDFMPSIPNDNGDRRKITYRFLISSSWGQKFKWQKFIQTSTYTKIQLRCTSASIFLAFAKSKHSDTFVSEELEQERDNKAFLLCSLVTISSL